MVRAYELLYKIKVIATFLVIFGAYMDILFNIKVKIVVLIQWSFRSPSIVLTIEPRMVTMF